MTLLNKTLFFSGALIKKFPFILNSLLKLKSDSLRIVYYHVVSNNKYPYYFDNKGISEEEFRNQLLFLKKHFEIISLSEGLRLAEHGGSLRKKLVITFDDGFMDNYTAAAPILESMDCTATFFLIGNCIDNKDLMWRNKLLVINKSDPKLLEGGIQKVSEQFNLNTKKSKHLMNWSFEQFPMEHKEDIVNSLWRETLDFTLDEYLDEHRPYMATSHLKELKEQGFEFGSHSMSHPNFSKLSYEMFKTEIDKASHKIEAITEASVKTFSYPFGHKAKPSFEERFLKEKPDGIVSFLGTRNKLNNKNNNIRSWGRDNLEFPFEIALSRFLVVAALRGF